MAERHFFLFGTDTEDEPLASACACASRRRALGAGRKATIKQEKQLKRERTLPGMYTSRMYKMLHVYDFSCLEGASRES